MLFQPLIIMNKKDAPAESSVLYPFSMRSGVFKGGGGGVSPRCYDDLETFVQIHHNQKHRIYDNFSEKHK